MQDWKEIYRSWDKRLLVQFDHSRLWQEFSALSMQNEAGNRQFPGVEVIGSGTHFLVARSKHFPQLVAKVATEEFFRVRKGRQGLEGWWRAVRELQRVAAPLIPPMTPLVMDPEKGVIFIMLYGDEARPSAIAAEPGSLWWKQLQLLLAQLQMVLDDVPQFRMLDGVPFLADLSDLRYQGK